MPPPKLVAMLPLTVLLTIVRAPLLLMPAPVVAVFSRMVLLRMVNEPLLLMIPPPALPPALLLTVLLVKVNAPKLLIPPELPLVIVKPFKVTTALVEIEKMSKLVALARVTVMALLPLMVKEPLLLSGGKSVSKLIVPLTVKVITSSAAVTLALRIASRRDAAPLFANVVTT